MKLYQVSKLVSKINHCVQLNNKKEFIHYNYTKSDLILLAFLLKHGYITSFNILDDKIIQEYNINKKKIKKIKNALCITLKFYNNKCIIKKIKNISTPGRALNFTYQNLKNLYNYQNWTNYIISTSQGLMTLTETINKNIGGFIFFRIY